MKLLNKILLATDFGAAAEQAVSGAVQIGKIFNSEIILVHVIPTSDSNELDTEYITKSVKYELDQIKTKIIDKNNTEHEILCM